MPKHDPNQPQMINELGPIVDAMPSAPTITPDQAASENDRAQSEMLAGHPAPTEQDKQVGQLALRAIRNKLSSPK